MNIRLSFLLLYTFRGHTQPTYKSVVGKVFCGYQGWFNCKGDGSPRDTWVHWGGNPPALGDLSFEVYPDVSDYAASSLFQTGFADLSDGQPAKVFSSYKKDVIDVQCVWMQKYEIDGVALKRFLGPVLSSASIKENRDSIAVRLKRSSEKYGNLYYLIYDMAPDDVEGFKSDVLHMENDIHFMNSPNYAVQDGKPVICLWGIGFDHRDGNGYSDNSQDIIDWLHGKGYYVIGGVPSRWRNTDGSGDVVPGYENVFASLDMISPWTPGLNSDSHDEYFGTTNPPEYIGNQTETTFNPGIQENNTTYFWRINEINSDGTQVDNVWSFSTITLSDLETEKVINSQNHIMISNPGNRGNLNIEVNYNKQPILISIYRLDGTKVYSSFSTKKFTDINLTEFNRGIYIVHVKNRNMSQNELILIK